MRNRFLAIATAAAVAVSGFSAPAAFAEGAPYLPGVKVDASNFNKDDFKNKFNLPTNAPQDVIL